MDKNDLLKKWLNDTLSEAEKQQFFSQEDAAFNQQLLDDAKYFKASQFAELGDFNSFKNKYNSRNKSKNTWLRPFLRIAAVAVITLGVYYSFFTNNLTEIATLEGEKVHVELPDQSLVQLNALSEIAFNERRWDKEREVRLQGEAYFQVAKGEQFDVLTEDGIVTVVGTEFNVKQRYNYFEVKCFEGKVQVEAQNFKELLEAGEAIVLYDGQFTTKNTSFTEPHWINNKSVFEAVPLNEVFAELQRQYAIDIQFEGVNASRLFTGGFEHGDLKNALMSVTQPMDLTFEMVTSNQVKVHAE